MSVLLPSHPIQRMISKRPLHNHTSPSRQSYRHSPLLNSNPSSLASNSWLTSAACFLTPQILACAVLSVPTLPTSLAVPLIVPSVCPCSGTRLPCISPSCPAGEDGGDALLDVIFCDMLRCCKCWNGDGNTFEGPIATNSNPLERARIHIMPYSSCTVMQLRSLSESRISWVVGEGGRVEVTRDDVVALNGW